MTVHSANLTLADDRCYQLAALLRTVENKARDLRDDQPSGDNTRDLGDIALLCEAGNDLLDYIHDTFNDLCRETEKQAVGK